MPMDPAYPDLEMDIIEKHFGTRVWQEMAKSPALPGNNVVNSNPHGIFPKHMRRKKEKTQTAVETESTQVMRKGKEG